jgi:uncharacterized membrane protein
MFEGSFYTWINQWPYRRNRHESTQLYLFLLAWFIIYAVGVLFKVPILDKVPWQAAISNFITTSIFGLIFAVILNRLIKKTTWKRSS